jgi:cytochrome P450
MQVTRSAAALQPGKGARLPPGPGLNPRQQFLRWLRDGQAMLEACQREFGNPFTLRFPNPSLRHPFTPVTMVLFADAPGVRTILTASPDVAQAGAAASAANLMFGHERSLLRLDGEDHAEERRLLLPPFLAGAVGAYAGLIEDCIDAVLERWQPGRALPLQPEMQRIALAVIIACVFGVSDPALRETLRERITRMLDGAANITVATAANALLPIYRWTRIGRLPSVSPVGRLVARVDEVDALLEQAIAERRTTFENRNDVLSLVLRELAATSRTRSNRDIRDELITLLVAGHETTAASLAWYFDRVLREPQVLATVVDEIRDAARRALPADARLPYLEATIRESLRIHPIFPFVARHLTRPLRVGDWELPAGVLVAPCIPLLHRNPECWPEPDRFDPHRFLERTPPTYAWIPFGGGGRRCIGMELALLEMRLVIRRVLASTRLRPESSRRAEVVWRGSTFAPHDGARVVIEEKFS